MSTNRNAKAAPATEAPVAEATEGLGDLWPERKASKTGNNPCRCVRLAEGQGTAHWVFITGDCPAHTKREFSQGHDAKTKAAWMSAYRAGIQTITVRTADGEMERTGTPMEFAELRGWGHFLTEGKENAKAMARLAKQQEAATATA
jgi:hypothetical protein